MSEPQRSYLRFTLSDRLQHWVMTASFTVLAVTGLPQRYALAGWAERVIAGLGGIESVRIIHRVAAVVFIVVTLFHFIALGYRVYVLHVRLSMMPGLKDITDMLDAVRYNLGLARRRPRFPRYNFAEKIEYWAVIWGAVLMGLTGFMLWNPIATARFLPGEFIPAAKTAHSAEALLAVLAVLIWHVYWVHVKTFNRAMFSGKLTREQMEEEHAEELAEIGAGRKMRPVAREVKRGRERVFVPVAAVSALLMGIGLYAFVTLEQTAITTVPPAETAQAFVPATPTATWTPTVTPIPSPTPEATATPVGSEASLVAGGEEKPAGAPVIPHELEGREACLMCHGPGAAVPYPSDHGAYKETMCQVCHRTEGTGPVPAAVKHSLEGRADCLVCHALDLLPESHQVGDFSTQDCLVCHAEGSDAGQAEGSPAGGAAGGSSSVSFEGELQPLLEGKCGTCHAETGLGGLQVIEYEALMAGGESGEVIVAGSPEESLIVAKMEGEHPALLTGDELQSLIDWIAAGAEDN